MSDYVFPGMMGLWVIALMVAMIFTTSYSDGYCDALGGTKISSSLCNVNGKVADIP